MGGGGINGSWAEYDQHVIEELLAADRLDVTRVEEVFAAGNSKFEPTHNRILPGAAAVARERYITGLTGVGPSLHLLEVKEYVSHSTAEAVRTLTIFPLGGEPDEVTRMKLVGAWFEIVEVPEE